MSNKTRQIALAIDPVSEEASKTIEWAIENFLRPTDEIHAIMVMVLDCEFGEQESIELPPTDSLETIEKELTLEKMRAMDKAVDKIKAAGFQVKTHVFKTDTTHACNVLIDFLDTKTMDCLIMGSRNLSGWKRFFMGSFSDYVQSHVHCPVLIVK
ncbi:F-box domain-containing protein [Mucor velutinosus]|uniref:F-box domain-containing protein n=1 Tax=Mucor velutinosus TaxID=708070 RepID=A0AAN7DKL1_9FUNG|nr:F-box domain-containing protein [Mucor velutinosus]